MSTATLRPFCGKPIWSGEVSRCGLDEIKVEHSDIPNASYTFKPVASVHAACKATGIFSPALRACRRCGNFGICTRTILRKTPGAAAKRVALDWASRFGKFSGGVPSFAIRAVAPTLHGSINPVPSVKVQLNAPACNKRSSLEISYQSLCIIRRAQIARCAC